MFFSKCNVHCTYIYIYERMGYDTDLDCSTGIWWSLWVCTSTTWVSSWLTVVDVSSFLGWLLANSAILNRNCKHPTLMQLLWWSKAVPSQPAPLPPIRLELLALQLQGFLGPPWARLLIMPSVGTSTVSAHISPSGFLDLLPPADLANKAWCILRIVLLVFWKQCVGGTHWCCFVLWMQVHWVTRCLVCRRSHTSKAHYLQLSHVHCSSEAHNALCSMRD